MAGEQDVPPWNPDELRLAYTYVAIADHVVARIKAGNLPAGARLPGERDMAEEYGAALGTVRRAVKELRERGWLITLKAKGTYVRPREDWPQD